jgi:Domain of unknown function (DUF243)
VKYKSDKIEKMKVCILLSIVALAAARPEAGYAYNAPAHQGYNYNPPSHHHHHVSAPVEVVHKHVYVHVPPPEQDDEPHQHDVQQAPAQVHYKIIFIKAPSYEQNLGKLLAAQQSKTEEKTLVYVLSKKPDEINYETEVAKNTFTPSKPEVYFIKYKAQKEAAHHHVADTYGPPTVAVPAAAYGPAL